MARRRSYVAWYLMSPFFAFGLIRVALALPRFMDTKRDFTPVYHESNVPPEAHLANPYAAKDAASAALRDLAHEASSAGAIDVAKRAYDAESAIQRGDARAVRVAMQRLHESAGDAARIAAQLELARVRVDAWLALVVSD